MGMSFALQIIRGRMDRCWFSLEPADGSLASLDAGELWFHAVCSEFSINKSSTEEPGGIVVERRGDSVSVGLDFDPGDTVGLPDTVVLMRCELVFAAGGQSRKIAEGTLMVLSDAGRPFGRRPGIKAA
jgi:hypothetical protein